MGFACYLAMTAAEIHKNHPLPPQLAYMACHFSPYEAGLANCPEALPRDSVLILNDLIPPLNQDPEIIRQQLVDLVQAFSCAAVLLDFQRPEDKHTAAIAAALAKGLPCPVVISCEYGRNLDCAVLLPPVPPDVPLEIYLSPWPNRPLWLELSHSALQYCVTAQGSQANPVPSLPETGHRDEKLHCHYHIEAQDDRISFTLFRTAEDHTALLREARRMGVTGAIGLWQEFPQTFLPGK